MSAPCVKEAPARVIFNPTSGAGAWTPEELRAVLGDMRLDWVCTEHLGDAREAAREWRGLLVVAGGDGTLNEAVHGLGLAGFPEDVTLALLPTGTGNDLARTLCVPADPEGAGEVLRAGRVRPLDAARARSGEVGERFFVNVAVGGAGAEVSEAADDEGFKGRWGKLAYSRAFLDVARSFDAPNVRLVIDGEERRSRALNVVVGNCRYAGGGWPVAPRANPEDGLLDLVVVEQVGPLGLLDLGRKALAEKEYLGDEGVLFARGRSIRVETVPAGGFGFNTTRIDELPFEDGRFDGAMINQVLHHLPDDPAEGFPEHRRVFRELARVLKPGGALVVNTCSQEQLLHGYWHYGLIRAAADALRSRYAPLDELAGILADCGFEHRGRLAPTDAAVQGESYLDPRGPLKEEWRDGDSVWSLAAEDSVEHALARIRDLDERGELEAYVARNDARRPDIGQVSVIYASNSRPGL